MVDPFQTSLCTAAVDPIGRSRLWFGLAGKGGGLSLIGCMVYLMSMVALFLYCSFNCPSQASVRIYT